MRVGQQGTETPSSEGCLGSSLAFNGRDYSCHGSQDVQSDEGKHEPEVEIMSEAKSGVDEEDDQRGESEEGMKSAPSCKVPETQPADAFAKRKSQCEEREREKRVASDLFVKNAAPKLVDLIPPRQN